ncbi:hypothetical protein K438DRAFT_1782204 [Mycena galopus ATCC 62051]|nr:hypothetical protein K438DRAFT_1782204 [Mycena galopus ATCC 62051]
MVQIFFAWRIWMLNKYIFARITTVLIVLAIASIALAIVWKTKDQLNTILLAEISILKSLTALLSSCRASPVRRTETLINRIIINVVETGVITVVAALLDLTLYLLSIQGQTFHTALAAILGKFYSNVLMANLNGRARSNAFKAGLQDTESGGMELNIVGGSPALEARGVIVSTQVRSDMGAVYGNEYIASFSDI